jgi:ribosomal protein S18 acetylase RimI-like enzyme
MPRDELRVVALAPARADVYLRFFDEARCCASVPPPQWASCYCHFHHVPPPLEWTTFDAAANRLAMEARIACGEMEGYLAMRDEQVVGWLNAQPRHRLQHCEARIGAATPALDVPLHEAAAIVCFAVLPDARADDIAHALLDEALADLATRGLRVVDAWPRADEAGDVAHDRFRGRRAWFAAAGFDVVAHHAPLLVMRKRFAASPA